MNKIKRMIKNWKGGRLGYGGCSRCGDTWDWKQAEFVKYEKNSSMFPLCRECFNKISMNSVLFYCIMFMKEEWGKSKDYIKKKMPMMKKSIGILKGGGDL